MYRGFQRFLPSLISFAIFVSFLTWNPETAYTTPQKASQRESQKTVQDSEAPDGWTVDERFLLLGKEAYRSEDGGVFATIDRVPTPKDAREKDSREKWIKEFIKGKLSRYTLENMQGPIQLVDEKKRPVEGGYLVQTLSKNKKGEKVIVTFAVLFREETQVWKFFWGNADTKKNSKAIASACNFLAKGGRKTPIPKGDIDKLMADLKKRKSAKATDQKKPATKDAKSSKPKPFVAAPGKGVAADQLRGVIFDFGKQKMKNVWVNDMPMRIPEWSGTAVYVVFKDGWAYRNPSVAPADLNVAESRRVEPKKWIRWDDVKMNTPTGMMAPLPKGTRIEISVQRPSTSSSSKTSVRTSWKNLKLTSKGRFETGATVMSSRQTGIDSSLGPSSNSINSTGKDGSFSGISSSYVAGGGMLQSKGTRRSSGNKGAHTGTYLIEGNTIELRYDNGTITRAVFGFDGKREIIFGGTNYWVPKKSK